MAADSGPDVTLNFVVEARRLRARAEADGLARARVAREALAAGIPVRSIGPMFGLAPHNGYRLLGQDRHTRAVGQTSPAEVIWRHTAGEIETETMMADLLARHDIHQDWHQIKDALDEGRLGDEEYARLAASAGRITAGSKNGRSGT